jgi:hypothetical protein
MRTSSRSDGAGRTVSSGSSSSTRAGAVFAAHKLVLGPRSPPVFIVDFFGPAKEE